MKKFTLYLALLMIMPLNAIAQDDDGFGDFDLDAGGETNFDLSDVDTSATEEGGHQFYGFIKEEIGYAPNKEEFNFAKMRTTLNVTYDIDYGGHWKSKFNVAGFYDAAYGYNGTKNYTPENLDSMENEFEAKDFFVEGPMADWLHVRAGRQVIAWGQSEVSQINDLANPRDNREMGMVDLEDARLPVAAIKWVATAGDWEFNLVTMHEFRANKIPAAESEFDLLASYRSSATVNKPIDPEEANQELLVRVYKSYNGGDFSLYYGKVYVDNYSLAFKSYNAATKTLTLQPTYEEITSIGASANQVWGSWLLRVEAAKKSGVPHMRNDMTTQLQTGLQTLATPSNFIYDSDSGLVETYVTKDLLQFALGIEYSGFVDFTFSLEGAVDQIQEYNANLQSKEVSGVSTFITTHQAFNDNLTTRFIWFHFTGSNGDVMRVTSDYNILDGVTIGGGLVDYSAVNEDSLLDPFVDNDRIFVTGKYSF